MAVNIQSPQSRHIRTAGCNAYKSTDGLIEGFALNLTDIYNHLKGSSRLQIKYECRIFLSLSIINIILHIFAKVYNSIPMRPKCLNLNN